MFNPLSCLIIGVIQSGILPTEPGDAIHGRHRPGSRSMAARSQRCSSNLIHGIRMIDKPVA
jgi:hypothetical protein